MFEREDRAVEMNKVRQNDQEATIEKRVNPMRHGNCSVLYIRVRRQLKLEDTLK